MSARKASPALKPAFVKVAKVDQVLPGHSLLVDIDDVRIAIFNLKGELYAIENICTHDGGPLGEGTIVNENEVKCPRHGARFDIRTGAARSLPAIRPTQTFAVRVEGDDIFVEAPE